MTNYEFSAIRETDKWISPAYVSIEDNGLLSSIKNKPDPDTNYEKIDALALPGIPNSHSHAFQYAMVGLAETHDIEAGDFWSWRERMYKIALTVEPEDVENIASMVYAEMLRHGYTQVTEFHYIHNNTDGDAYDRITEMSDRCIAAAKNVGINITLVPMLYRRGGFNLRPKVSQRRFINKSLATYIKLTESLQKAYNEDRMVKIGFGAHSLRAVAPEELHVILDHFSEIPFHLHIAEQIKEVEDAKNYLRARPIDWLFDHYKLDENTHLVHATHITELEMDKIIKAKSNVILCPSTEGNLGDGIFPLQKYISKGGRWCIGTDSHIGLNPFEELRILDYGQRLIHHNRTSFLSKDEPKDSASAALKPIIFNGLRAAGWEHQKSFFKKGQPFNALLVDSAHALFSGHKDFWMNTIMYHMDVSDILGTISDGKLSVKNHEHINGETIRSKFMSTLKKLKIRNR